MRLEHLIAGKVITFAGWHPAGVGVNAAAVVSHKQAFVVDSLFRPKEAERMVDYLRRRGVRPVALLITHWHLDHTGGTHQFLVEIIAHKRCPELMKTELLTQLEAAKVDFGLEIRVRHPNRTFDRKLTLHLEDEEFTLKHFPGHTPDSMAVYLKNERILIAGDAVMELPFVSYGDSAASLNSLKRIERLRPTKIIQGHGKVCGIEQVRSDVAYLEECRSRVREAVDSGKTVEDVGNLNLEEFLPKNRIRRLHPVWKEIHLDNLSKIYKEFGPSHTTPI